MKASFALLLGFLAPGLFAAEIRIGLFYGKNIQSVVISIIEGEYSLTANSQVVSEITKGGIFQVDITNTGISVHNAIESYGPFEQVSLFTKDSVGIFTVRPVFPAFEPKESEGRIDFSLEGGHLKLVNTLEIDSYIAGTVEAEGGANALTEYYKAQAVLARTFAIGNYYRHAHQGFNLCDQVHCQAYNGKSRMNREIYRAVNQTAGVILANSNGEPVVTAYHSSCGGMTSHAAIEWNRDLEYLVPVSDPFCNKSKNLNWNRTIKVVEWNAYLTNIGYTGDRDILFTGINGRLKYLNASEQKLPLPEIRRRFNLKSSWFNLEKAGDQIIVHGHGYGHGLGMCQEGAMEMARVGYTYVDILMFYFRGVELHAK